MTASWPSRWPSELDELLGLHRSPTSSSLVLPPINRLRIVHPLVLFGGTAILSRRIARKCLIEASLQQENTPLSYAFTLSMGKPIPNQSLWRDTRAGPPRKGREDAGTILRDAHQTLYYERTLLCRNNSAISVGTTLLCRKNCFSSEQLRHFGNHASML